MIDVLVRNWWAFVIRGVLAIVFGLFAFFLPHVTMLSLVLVFAAYAIIEGIFAIVGSVRAARQGERWGLLAFEGIVGIAAGIAAAMWPHITVIFFIALIAAWALITGGLLLAAAISMSGEHGRGWLILSAIVSLVYGALLVIAPMIGAVVLTWWLGAYAIVFGIAMIAFGFRLRTLVKSSPLRNLS